MLLFSSLSAIICKFILFGRDPGPALKMAENSFRASLGQHIVYFNFGQKNVLGSPSTIGPHKDDACPHDDEERLEGDVVLEAGQGQALHPGQEEEEELVRERHCILGK